ncbi:hypothetical protein BGY98DRAFT_1182263, partial [Russula aff. rugulosa BPL654]
MSLTQLFRRHALGPAALNVFAIFEDLCLLGNGERPIPSSYSYHNTTSSTCPSNAFPLALRGTRHTVVFLLLKRFSSKLEAEAEVIRVLAMKTMRRLCSDVEFMRGVWQRHDALTTDSDIGGASSAHVFTLMHGVGIPASDSQSHLHDHGLDSVVEMVAIAASATVSNVVRIGCQPFPVIVFSVDELDKADAPLIPEAYICLLDVQFLVPLSEGRISFHPLQHARGPKATRGFNRARPCTNSPRPYAARNRASPGWATPSHLKNHVRFGGRRHHITVTGTWPVQFGVLTASYGRSWFAILDALQSADYIFTARGTATPSLAPVGISAVA